jgi:hypothetical protein
MMNIIFYVRFISISSGVAVHFVKCIDDRSITNVTTQKRKEETTPIALSSASSFFFFFFFFYILHLYIRWQRANRQQHGRSKEKEKGEGMRIDIVPRRPMLRIERK